MSIFFKHIIGILRRIAGDTGVAAHLLEHLQKVVLLDVKQLEQLFEVLIWIFHQRNHQVFDRNIFVLHRIRNLFRFGKHHIDILCDINFSCLSSRTGDAGHLVNLLFDRLHKCLRVLAHLFKQLGNQALINFQQRIQQMLLLDLHIVVFQCQIVCKLDGLQRFLGEFLCIHSRSLLP